MHCIEYFLFNAAIRTSRWRKIHCLGSSVKPTYQGKTCNVRDTPNVVGTSSSETSNKKHIKYHERGREGNASQILQVFKLFRVFLGIFFAIYFLSRCNYYYQRIINYANGVSTTLSGLTF
jgi:hypothetical protein